MHLAQRFHLEKERPNLGSGIRPLPSGAGKGAISQDSLGRGEIEEVDLPGHQFRRGAQVVLPVGPLPRLVLAFDRDPRALLNQLTDQLCGSIPGDDALPDNAFGPDARFVAVGLDGRERKFRKRLAGPGLQDIDEAANAAWRGGTVQSCCGWFPLRGNVGTGDSDCSGRISGAVACRLALPVAGAGCGFWAPRCGGLEVRTSCGNIFCCTMTVLRSTLFEVGMCGVCRCTQRSVDRGEILPWCAKFV